MSRGAGVELVQGGDLFESDCSTLVNAVNCRGAMGAGIALEFKRRFPAMFADYRCRCRRGEVRLGQPYIWRSEDGRGISVLNFPTKDHWRDFSRLEPLLAGLGWLRSHYRQWGVSSLAVPALGCGYGGLRWEEVRPVLIESCAELDIPVRIYEPIRRRGQGPSGGRR
jgi:O-acetyl-ADP-ribose deacetylase (regulator of RNase III)